MTQFMNKVSSSVKATMTAAVLITFSAMSFAQTTGQQLGSEDQPMGSGAQPMGSGAQQMGGETQQIKTFEDVEELLDDIARYDGQKVKVPGEVEEKIDERAFILESGGIFNDEIVVMMPEGRLMVTEDSEVVVTGTVRAIGFVEIEREYGWDLDPQIKVELEDVEAFIIAESIEQKEDD